MDNTKTKAFLLFWVGWLTVAATSTSAYLPSRPHAAPLRLVPTDSRLPLSLLDAAVVYDELSDAIYVLGGSRLGQTVPSDQIIKYSLGTGAVEVVGRFRPSHSAVAAMHDGQILHFGGYDEGPLTVVYRISPQTGAAIAVGNLPVPLYNSAVAWDSEGGVGYIFGGLGGGGSLSDRVLRYNATTNTVEQVATLPQRRDNAGAVWGWGGAYAFGGHGAASFTDIFRLEPESWTGSNLTLTLLPTRIPPPGLQGPCAVFERRTGQIYIVDGANPVLPLLRYNPTDHWDIEKLPVGGWPGGLGFKYFGCAYVHRLHRVYVLGGWDYEQNVGSHEISYIDLP